MDLKEVGFDSRNQIDLTQDRGSIPGLCKDDNKPPGSLKVN